MVESPRNCVLQWAGHAGYITERFSGLLARQALVDVTLICEEQKLRVHKLVLASNSIYFEEILQQDLGEEPIIFLRDLNFEILKAMIEFMYCGETTISQQCLPTLLNAAKIFKVKELTQLIDTLMEPEVTVPDGKTGGVQDTNCESKVVNNILNEKNCVHVKSDKLGTEESSSDCPNNGEMNLSENYPAEDDRVLSDEQNKTELALYDEICNECPKTKSNVSVSTLDSSSERQHAKTGPVGCKANEISQRYLQSNVECDEVAKDRDLKPKLFEQCIDFTDIGEFEQNSGLLSHPSHQQNNKDVAENSSNKVDVPSKVGECTKVYTHKRRKSIDEVKNKLPCLNNVIPEPTSTDCIDLLDEPSGNNIPVTLLTSLDMESAEYILSLSAENIQSIVGGTLSEQHGAIRCKDAKVQSVASTCDRCTVSSGKENTLKKSLNLSGSDHEKPVLRRSTRLNQQEHEESIDNSSNTGESMAVDNQFKKGNSPNRTEVCTKGKRKVKEMDRKISEQCNVGVTHHKRNVNNSRNPKSDSKLIIKRNSKSMCSAPAKEREEQKLKAAKIKCDMSGKMENSNISFFTSSMLNTTGHINRAFWGDMSDVEENDPHRLDMTDYTPNREIPFAVGLLPLRTALEKMQATPDYQPRKTRSSVAPFNKDSNNLKRKNSSFVDSSVNTKRQANSNDVPNENTNAVCHIQIRTAPPQYVKNRKRFLTEHITTLESTTVMNRR